MSCSVSPALALTKTIRWYKLLHLTHVDFYQLGIWPRFHLVQERNKTYSILAELTTEVDPQFPQDLAGGELLAVLTSCIWAQ